MNLSSADLTKLGIALGLCAAVYKFVGNPMAKTAAVAVGSVILAKNVPYLGAALA
jgi:hypothetical protein